MNIPKKLRNLPASFEAMEGSAVHRCPEEVNAVVYGIPTAFRQNGDIECRLQLSLFHPIRCMIPLKIQWLRAKSVDGTEEFFFKTVTGSIDHHMGLLGIDEEGFKKLVDGLAIDEEESHFRSRRNQKDLIKCVVDGLMELNRKFASILLV
ncbi:uncharacterized protein LOC100898755 [Galendromus occidentalis]|uniref:Uncharacterized protein LOC100898755 n=1 Tax=Galendromus occidentalis TaxID=34638 RepID=A0AAJ6QVN3_9ACAR|nr:uncharacterized protein LOC100898755 [Galendromus occidentalis]